MFLSASALAGLGAALVTPTVMLIVVSSLLPLFGRKPPDYQDQRLMNWVGLGGLVAGLSVGPLVYFLTSRPRDRRSLFHWWRLIRVYVVMIAPFAIFIWQFPGLSTTIAPRVAVWLLLIIPPLWLPDVYRRVMPRVRSGYYQRAHWVRRNGVPRWCNVAIAGAVFVAVALALPIVLDFLRVGQLRMLNRGGGLGEFSMWVLLTAVALAIPYVVARLLYARLTWKLADAPGHCRRCGYDLTKNESGVCPECGVEIVRAPDGVSQGMSSRG